jgi:hypothetical protein
MTNVQNNNKSLSFTNRIKLAVLRNVIEGDNRQEAFRRAVEWMRTRVIDEDDFVLFFNDGLEALVRDSEEPLDKSRIEYLRIPGEEHLLLWAEAALKLIEAELEQTARVRAIGWLHEVLNEEIGRASTAIWFAQQRRPSADRPQRVWAERAFQKFSQLKNFDDRAIVYEWLEREIASFVGGEEVAQSLIQDWMRAPAQSYGQDRPRRDTLPSSAPAKTSEITSLKPTGPSEEEVARRAVELAAELGQDVDESTIACAERQLAHAS